MRRSPFGHSKGVQTEGNDAMAIRRSAHLLSSWRLLLGAGTAVGLTDGQLLGRFVEPPCADCAAFDALVRRHGPMVLGVCRRVLVDPNDVDDAFQATFLILARRAHLIRDRDRVGSWLHRVARRVARKARAKGSRRRRHEVLTQFEPLGITVDDPEPGHSELASAVLREVDRLPERLRLPVVLCDLEGLPRAEAANRLGWFPGTLHSRLARARQRLRDQLSRRGFAPSRGLDPP